MFAIRSQYFWCNFVGWLLWWESKRIGVRERARETHTRCAGYIILRLPFRGFVIYFSAIKYNKYCSILNLSAYLQLNVFVISMYFHKTQNPRNHFMSHTAFVPLRLCIFIVSNARLLANTHSFSLSLNLGTCIHLQIHNLIDNYARLTLDYHSFFWFRLEISFFFSHFREGTFVPIYATSRLVYKQFWLFATHPQNGWLFLVFRSNHTSNTVYIL